jgi:hypothetical protein
MKIQQIREIARGLGIDAGSLDKAHLVRLIQLNEGNFDCFATASEGVCDQYGCAWRDDCFVAAQKAVADSVQAA